MKKYTKCQAVLDKAQATENQSDYTVLPLDFCVVIGR